VAYNRTPFLNVINLCLFLVIDRTGVLRCSVVGVLVIIVHVLGEDLFPESVGFTNGRVSVKDIDLFSQIVSSSLHWQRGRQSSPVRVRDPWFRECRDR